MTEILLTVIIILLIINIVIALTKNNRLQTERLEGSRWWWSFQCLLSD